MNDIDLLMSKPALDLTPADLDAIVAYHRRQRAGGKAEAAKIEKQSKMLDDIDIAAIMQAQLPAPTTPPKPVERMIRKV